MDTLPDTTDVLSGSADSAILVGDCREMLRQLPDGCVQTCITSPPYFGLRDYGTGSWEGGDPECDHRPDTAHQKQGATSQRVGRANAENQRNENFRHECPRCGAERVDYQIGLEATPELYVAKLVDTFREVRRVLRDDGTVWLNLGDSYATGAGRVGDAPGGGKQGEAWKGRGPMTQANRMPLPGLKPKDLIGVPWRVASALQADGWYLRSDIIWAKPNPMPESVTDRPTVSHEHIFLLAKSARYFYDAEAIKEGATYAGPNGAQHSPYGQGFTRRSDKQREMGEQRVKGGDRWSGFNESGRGKEGLSRNKRSVWTVATQPFSEAHFATFPEKLIEPCVLAGSSPRACGACGAPWERQLGERELDLSRPQARRARELAEEAGLTDEHLAAIRAVGATDAGKAQITHNGYGRNDPAVQALADEAKEALGGYYREFTFGQRPTVGWRSTCDHDDDSGRCIVLDPFAGTCVTGISALRHGRRFIGVELNPEYAELARRRMAGDAQVSFTAEGC